MLLMSIIEQSIKNLDSLPVTVQKNMSEIRRLDFNCQKLNLETQNKICKLIETWKTISKETKKKSFDFIRLDFQKMHELADEKIRLSEQTYELVDKYIIKLDNDTAKLNLAVRKKYIENSSLASTSKVFQTFDSNKRKRKNTFQRNSGKRLKKKENLEPKLLTKVEPFVNSGTSLVDMPVDPNEPTYCVCQQVSFGQMVMCDNKNCLIEWFHFQCVGLTSKPRGKWYCESCTEQRRKKN